LGKEGGVLAFAGVKMDLSYAMLIILHVATTHEPCFHQLGCFRYNCADYTRDAVLLLRSAGYEAYPMCGLIPSKSFSYHAWVGINLEGKEYSIDPQTGRFVDYITGRRCVVRGVV
jgi:hypothetical protein